MIRVHQDFQGRHYYQHFGGDPDARESHRTSLSAEEWALAERFADEWDQMAFDPDLRHAAPRALRAARAAAHRPGPALRSLRPRQIAAYGFPDNGLPSALGRPGDRG